MTLSVINPAVLDELEGYARAVPEGVFVEVGVYRGGSAVRLARVARERRVRLHLFDTFQGIPFRGKYDVHNVGDFGDVTEGEVRAAIPDAIFHVGVFPNTFPEDWDEPIALAHVDCDQYLSVLMCCRYLKPFMVDGGLMVFDDYDVLPGARLAVDETFEGRVSTSLQGKAYVRC